MGRTILVATDGTPAAMGALRYAAGLEEESRCRVHVLGVVEPVPVFDAGFMMALPEMEVYESRREALLREISGQLRAALGPEPTWPVSVLSGVPGQRIVAQAEELGADLILMGLGRHGAMDRVFGTETVLQVLRVSHVPILAVPETVSEVPRSAVLGVDFSLFSRRAAEAVLPLLRSPWEVHLVHVLSGMEFLPTLSEQWRVDYEAELTQRLKEFADALDEEPGCEIHLRILEGEPAHEILGYGLNKGAGLLAAGSHGHSFVGRLLMGSVSTRLVRSAQCAVFVVPPPERSAEIMTGPDAEGRAVDWAEELQRFTRANAGRKTTLEFHDPDLGIRESGVGFPLWGADFDAKRDRLDIMLGRSGTVEGHLTHSLPAPKEVRIVRGEDGRPEALHIELGRGRAVLKVHKD